MNTPAGGRKTALTKYGMLVAGTAILAFGLYNIHRQSDITEGGVLGLVLIGGYYPGPDLPGAGSYLLPDRLPLFGEGVCQVLGHRQP